MKTPNPVVEELVSKVKNLDPTDNPKFPFVGGYFLKEFVGEGAFAYVFRGTSDKFGRISRAIKFPKTIEDYADIETRKLVLSALANSPFSINFIGEGTFEGAPFVVEEFYEKSLAKVIEEKEGRLPTPEEIEKLGKDLLRGIDHFHNLGKVDSQAAKLLGLEMLIHADIKPSNIMMSENGSPSCKYNDFGIRIEEDKGHKRISSIASVESIRNKDRKGKVNIYVAPEVQRALLIGEEPPATKSSDIYSIGAVLFHFATSQAPEVWQKDPREVRKDLPKKISDWISGMLEKDPSKRSATAQSALKNLVSTVAEEEENGYLVWLTRNVDGTYTISKHPAHHSLWTSDDTSRKLTYNFRSEGGVPGLLYVPDFEGLVLCSFTRENEKFYQEEQILLDKELKEKGKNTSSQSSNKTHNFKYVGPRTSETTSLWRDKKTGFMLLTTKTRGTKELRIDKKTKIEYTVEGEDVISSLSVRTIPSFEIPLEMGDQCDVYESINKNAKGSYEKIENPKQVSLKGYGDFEIRVQDGAIKLKNARGIITRYFLSREREAKEIPLPFRYAIDAFWVPE